ncbi:MAG TPA: DUF4870 domain-containing protein [Opitutaceae bacterium]
MTSTSLTPDSTDTLLIILCHISSLLGVGIVLPLIVYLVKRREPGAVAAHAGEALNFHLSLLIYTVLCVPLVFVVIGVPLLIALGVVALVCTIIATVHAANGGFYRYPLTIRLVR